MDNWKCLGLGIWVRYLGEVCHVAARNGLESKSDVANFPSHVLLTIVAFRLSSQPKVACNEHFAPNPILRVFLSNCIISSFLLGRRTRIFIETE